MNYEKQREVLKILHECHKKLLPAAFKDYLGHPNGGTFMNILGCMTVIHGVNQKVFSDEFKDEDYENIRFVKETLESYIRPEKD